MNEAVALPEARAITLADLDVSDPRLLEQDAWRPFFARLQDPAGTLAFAVGSGGDSIVSAQCC